MTLSHQAMFQPAWTGLAFPAFLALSSVARAYVIPRQINTSQLLPKYDYVIVGGGTAGLTLADRLTEDPGTNVLVLEAGGWGDTDDILKIFFQQTNFTEYLASSSIEALVRLWQHTILFPVVLWVLTHCLRSIKMWTPGSYQSSVTTISVVKTANSRQMNRSRYHRSTWDPRMPLPHCRLDVSSVEVLL